MLVNNNTQAVSTVQQLKRPDMDPANAAASALYSGAVQVAQQSVTVPAAQKELDKAADLIDEAFAKTRVQLQTSTTDVPATSSTSGARSEFTDYMSKTPAERIREQLLKEQGLTEADVQNMTQEKQDAISRQVADRLKQQQEQQVAAKTADPQAQAVKETLAAI
jgi:TPP-dependent pyruvate/acetoin dehydrogenase alpha subunit